MFNRFFVLIQHQDEKTKAEFIERAEHALKHGIYKIIPLLSGMIKHAQEAQAHESERNAFISDVKNFIARLKEKYPYWEQERRKGNEIVFHLDDLAHAPDLVIMQ